MTTVHPVDEDFLKITQISFQCCHQTSSKYLIWPHLVAGNGSVWMPRHIFSHNTSLFTWLHYLFWHFNKKEENTPHCPTRNLSCMAWYLARVSGKTFFELDNIGYKRRWLARLKSRKTQTSWFHDRVPGNETFSFPATVCLIGPYKYQFEKG